jgi:hypothetical protein
MRFLLLIIAGIMLGGCEPRPDMIAEYKRGDILCPKGLDMPFIVTYVSVSPRLVYYHGTMTNGESVAFLYDLVEPCKETQDEN